MLFKKDLCSCFYYDITHKPYNASSDNLILHSMCHFEFCCLHITVMVLILAQYTCQSCSDYLFFLWFTYQFNSCCTGCGFLFLLYYSKLRHISFTVFLSHSVPFFFHSWSTHQVNLFEFHISSPYMIIPDAFVHTLCIFHIIYFYLHCDHYIHLLSLYLVHNVHLYFWGQCKSLIYPKWPVCSKIWVSWSVLMVTCEFKLFEVYFKRQVFAWLEQPCHKCELLGSAIIWTIIDSLCIIFSYKSQFPASTTTSTNSWQFC